MIGQFSTRLARAIEPTAMFERIARSPLHAAGQVRAGGPRPRPSDWRVASALRSALMFAELLDLRASRGRWPLKLAVPSTPLPRLSMNPLPPREAQRPRDSVRYFRPALLGAMRMSNFWPAGRTPADSHRTKPGMGSRSRRELAAMRRVDLGSEPRVVEGGGRPGLRRGRRGKDAHLPRLAVRLQRSDADELPIPGGVRAGAGLVGRGLADDRRALGRSRAHLGHAQPEGQEREELRAPV
mmetsp:Transcript_8459/g.28758  ORF Transcript_8459/g.28758 Transcript_8459/m.28758 type:complete len:240 (-) Transcript_8459:383-1102(-)